MPAAETLQDSAEPAQASEPPPRSRYDAVVMAASVGGFQALKEILGALPAGFPVPVAVVQHRTSAQPNLLADLLGRKTALRVKMAEEGEVLQPGTVYLAPPDLHMYIGHGGICRLYDGVKIRHVRSSANPLFTSAAGAFEGRIIAVVLTGFDRDATDGVQAVKAQGGLVIAQDEATSVAFGMPRSAIETGSVDQVLPLAEIAPMLLRLVKAGRMEEEQP